MFVRHLETEGRLGMVLKKTGSTSDIYNFAKISKTFSSVYFQFSFSRSN